MKNKEYINQMSNIHASDELISKTIKNIKTSQKVEKNFNIKKIMVGTAATLVLSIGSVGAYVGITGNTAILEKLGINLSKNYEDNKQIIKNEDNMQNCIKGNGFDAKLISAAVDNSSLVLEFDINLDEGIKCESPDLKIDDIAIYMPKRNVTESKDLIWTEESNSSKMENGTYKVFKYIKIKNAVIDNTNVWRDMFFEDEFVNCTISISSIIDKDTNKIVSEDVGDSWDFEFKLSKPENLSYSESELNKVIYYNDVEIKIEKIQESSFGNVISIFATEKNIDLNDVNDIQKLKFAIKDENGNDVAILSKIVNVTMEDYDKGQMNTTILEIGLKVDDVTNNPNYKIEVKQGENVNIDIDEIKNANDIILENLKSGTVVITKDNVFYPVDNILSKDEYYTDEYGVYKIDRSSEELNSEFLINK